MAESSQVMVKRPLSAVMPVLISKVRDDVEPEVVLGVAGATAVAVGLDVLVSLSVGVAVGFGVFVGLGVGVAVGLGVDVANTRTVGVAVGAERETPTPAFRSAAIPINRNSNRRMIHQRFLRGGFCDFFGGEGGVGGTGFREVSDWGGCTGVVFSRLWLRETSGLGGGGGGTGRAGASAGKPTIASNRFFSCRAVCSESPASVSRLIAWAENCSAGFSSWLSYSLPSPLSMAMRT